jgi:hypothetical protein
MNDVDPHAWLTDVLDRIAAHPASRIRASTNCSLGLEGLAQRGIHRGRCLNMQCNKVYAVTVIAAVAKRLGVGEDLLHEISIGMEPRMVSSGSMVSAKMESWSLPTKA